MRSILVASALLLVGLSGAAVAGPGGDEAYTLDLTAIPGGPMLYLKCSNPAAASTLGKDCGLLSIWQQTNAAERLQSTTFSFAGKPHPSDEKLLG